MSQMTSSARAGARTLHRPTTTTPRLRVVTGASPRPGAAFGIFCATLLATGLIGLLLLNTALAQGSFTLHKLRTASGQLTDTQDVLNQALEASKSPANLAAKAAGMGMVPAQSAAFLRLSDGRVIGVAKPAAPVPGFTVVRTTASPPHVAPALVAATTAKPATTTKPASTTQQATTPKPAMTPKPATTR
jgi:hypothetical protein